MLAKFCDKSHELQWRTIITTNYKYIIYKL